MAQGNPNPSPATRFKKGNPGPPAAPKGGIRLKDRLIKSADELIATKSGKKMTRADAMVEILWHLVLNDKDLDAIKFLTERTDGKVPSRLEVENQSVRFAFDDDVAEYGLGPERGSNGKAAEAASGSERNP